MEAVKRPLFNQRRFLTQPIEPMLLCGRQTHNRIGSRGRRKKLATFYFPGTYSNSTGFSSSTRGFQSTRRLTIRIRGTASGLVAFASLVCAQVMTKSVRFVLSEKASTSDFAK